MWIPAVASGSRSSVGYDGEAAMNGAAPAEDAAVASALARRAIARVRLPSRPRRRFQHWARVRRLVAATEAQRGEQFICHLLR